MFILSKVLSLLSQPLAWLCAVLLTSLVLVHRKPIVARRMGWAALTMVLILGWKPLPDLLLRDLEGRYPEQPLAADLNRYAGMVVLGGASAAGYVAQDHSLPQLNDAAERMNAPVAALRRNPGLRIVFTGGEGELFAAGPSEAARARAFFDSMGVAADRVTYEDESRNTFENAMLTALVPGIDRTQRWLLVTSAWHMPRAMATFTKAGWNVTAYPVDFRTGSATPWTEYSWPISIAHWHIALHECTGLVAYRITGRM